MKRTFKRFMQDLIKQAIYYGTIKQEEWYPNNWIDKFNTQDLLIIHKRNIFPNTTREAYINYIKEQYRLPKNKFIGK